MAYIYKAYTLPIGNFYRGSVVDRICMYEYSVRTFTMIFSQMLSRVYRKYIVTKKKRTFNFIPRVPCL